MCVCVFCLALWGHCSLGFSVVALCFCFVYFLVSGINLTGETALCDFPIRSLLVWLVLVSFQCFTIAFLPSISKDLSVICACGIS